MEEEIVTEVVIKKKKCKRCDYEWIPRQEGDPVFCPGCRSPYWNKERIRPKKEA